MPITVTCRRCEHEFSAWEDLAGQLVQCPKCEADVYVGDDEDWDEDDESEDDDDELRLAPAEESLITPTSMALPVAGAEDDESEVFDEMPENCPKCGAELNSELCGACNYHVKLRRVIASDVETYAPDENLGFKRWFNSQLSEGESFDSVFFWGKILFGFLLAGFTLIFFPYSLIITIPIVAAVVFLYVMIKRSPKSGDDAFYDVGSQMTLKIIRATGWRKLEWPFPKCKHYSVANTDFSDGDVAEMSSTGEIEALDFSGCPITDASLPHLADWRH